MFVKWTIYQSLRKYFSNMNYVRYFKLYLKYFLSIRPNLFSQLQPINNEAVSINKLVFLPLLETAHYRAFHQLILAKALEVRGAKVIVLVCDERLYGCELKNVDNYSNDPCLRCRFNLKNIIPLFNMDMIYLTSIISDKLNANIITSAKGMMASNEDIDYIYKGIDLKPVLNDSVVRYYYGDVKYDSEKYKKTKYQHILTMMMGLEAAEYIYLNYKPNIILGYMAAYSAWAPYKDYYEKKHVPVVNVMSTQFNYNSVAINPIDLYISNQRYYDYIKRRSAVKMNVSEKKTLELFFSSRINGTAEIFSDMKKFNNDNQVVFDTNKTNIALFTNIFWDVGMYMLNNLFKDVNEWVYETVRLVEENRSIHLYIKTHPMEKQFPGLGVADHLINRIGKLPMNVSIITPEMEISPYSLIRGADLVSVYNGTLGLEALYLHAKVLSCGHAPYSGLGLTTDITDIEEYKNCLNNPGAVARADYDEVEMYSYFYFIKQQIPWDLTDRVYNDNFKGYRIDSLRDLAHMENEYLDHLCECILDPKNTCPEDW
jgi:hypothetical protein